VISMIFMWLSYRFTAFPSTYPVGDYLTSPPKALRQHRSKESHKFFIVFIF
jgi:hypothetical protein